jgi:hypothetical protein
MKCGYCDEEKPIHRKLPDGEGLCIRCDQILRRETAGFPDCSHCKHRFWLMRIDYWGFRCLGCGSKFAGGASEETDDYRAPYRHPFVDHTGLG